MLQWPSSPTTPTRRLGETVSVVSIGQLTVAPEDPPLPPSRRWTLGATKHALGGRSVLEPIENSAKACSRRTSDEICLVSLSGSRHSSRGCLPPLDVDASDLEERRIKGCRGASEYLQRQSRRHELSTHEQFFVKESFQRFKSGAEMNCSDLYDVLDHLGYLGITEEAATSLAKEVSRFSTLDWKELLKVVECAGPWEYEQLQVTFKAHSTDLADGSTFVHVARLPLLLHDLGLSSDWQAIRESIMEALGLDIQQQPQIQSSDSEVSGDDNSFQFSLEQINLILATHRAAQCSSSTLLKCAETLFLSVARVSTLSQRPEVSIHRVPELLHRLHEYDVSDSVREICRRLRSGDLMSDASDASGDEDLQLSHTMAFSEFLIWMRRMRCLELGKHWERYQKVATSAGLVPATELSTLVPGLPPFLELQEELFAELGLEHTDHLSFEVLDCLRRHCALVKDLSTEEARYFSGVFSQFQSEDQVGFVDRADCLCIFRYMGFGLNSDEIYSLLLDAKAAGHRLLSLADFLNMIRACRSRQRGMIRTAYEMNAQEMGFSDLSDFEETGSALTMSDDEDSPKELIFGRRQSNESSRAAFRRRSSVKQEGTAKKVLQGEGLVVPQGALEALGSLGWSMEEDALEEGLTRIGLQNYRLLSLEDFMNLVKLLREEEAAQKQRQAGWTVSEAQDILCLFEAHGGSSMCSLDEEDLEHLLLDLDVRKGFEEQKQLLEKARLQSAVEGATEVTLSTCLYLLRFISEKGLRSVFGRESEAFHAEGCSEADVAAYRHLFRQIKNGDLCEMPDTPSSGLVRRSESGLKVPLLPGTKSSMPGKHKKIKKSIKREYPVLLKKIQSALAVPSSIQQVSCAAVMKFLRKLSQRCDERLTPLQQADLWKTIEDFSFSSPSRDFMDFASFVRVIGWVRRTDFANIRQESDKVGSFWALAESTLIR
ncbi:unnamed protein product [Durusdinium trenchii]|uniref:Uncharacterized protein n=2 Tax=Durusdinium trenchii TaxID=1381693 RepID=A0ABP0IJP4_9DINO